MNIHLPKLSRLPRVGQLILWSWVVLATYGCQTKGDPILVKNARDVGDYEWHYDRVRQIDLNCDGQVDYLVPGHIRESNRYILTAFLGPKTEIMKFSMVELGLEGQEQDSFCGSEVHFGPWKLTAPDQDEEIPAPKGYRPDLCSNGFYLSDDKCDAFHFYWDHAKNRLEWFRN